MSRSKDNGSSVRPFIERALEYDPQTGIFRWRVRPRSDFPSDHGARVFNTAYAGKIAGYLATSGYRKIRLGADLYFAHRIAWLLTHGVWPVDQTDHINGKRDDNRIANLRSVTATINRKNTCLRRNNTSGVVGVSFMDRLKKWRVTISNNHVGVFSNFDDAVAARKVAERENGYHPNHGRAA